MLPFSQMQLLEIPGFKTRGRGWRWQRADSGTNHHRNQRWNVLSRHHFQTNPHPGRNDRKSNLSTDQIKTNYFHSVGHKKWELQENFHNLKKKKSIHKNPTANIIPNRERQDTFFPEIGDKTKISFFITIIWSPS